MVAGTDGKLYAITAEQKCGSHQLIVRRIDPITMREEASIVTARTFPFDRIELVSSAAGTTYAHLVTDVGAEFLRVDMRSVTPIALPPDSGLMTGAAPDGSIWLFGGRARNTLSRFDPATGRVDRVPAADAPDGAFVGAVVFPSVGGGR
jgi:streptogramin lyase